MLTDCILAVSRRLSLNEYEIRDSKQAARVEQNLAQVWSNHVAKEDSISVCTLKLFIQEMALVRLCFAACC